MIALILLVILISRQGWEEILAGIRRIPPEYFLLAIALSLLSRLAVAVRWHILLNSAGVDSSVKTSLRITFAGLFSSNFLPTTIGGDVFRLAMAVRMGWDKVIAAASLVVDRLVGMAGMASAVVFGLGPLAQALSGVSPSMHVAGSTITAGLAGRLKRIGLSLFEAGAIWLRSPRGLLLAFASTWVHQLCVFAAVWLLLTGQGAEIDFWTAGGLWSFSYFVTLLPISINGLGVQELSMTTIYSTLGGVGIPEAATAALLVRTVQVLASVPGALFLSDILDSARQSGTQIE